MIKQTRYAPILKCKEGEFQALPKLPVAVKYSAVPIIDLVADSKKNMKSTSQLLLAILKNGKRKILYTLTDI